MGEVFSSCSDARVNESVAKDEHQLEKRRRILKPFRRARRRLAPLIDASSYKALLKGFEEYSTKVNVPVDESDSDEGPFTSGGKKGRDCHMLMPTFVQIVTMYITRKIRNALDDAVKLSCESAAYARMPGLRAEQDIQRKKDEARGLVRPEDEDDPSGPKRSKMAKDRARERMLFGTAFEQTVATWSLARDRLFVDYITPKVKDLAEDIFKAQSGPQRNSMSFPQFIRFIEGVFYQPDPNRVFETYLFNFDIIETSTVPKPDLFKAFQMPIALYRILIQLRAVEPKPRPQATELRQKVLSKKATSKQEQEFNENKLREIAFAEKLGSELDLLVQKMPIVTQVSCTRANSVNQLMDADYEQLFNWDVKIDSQSIFDAILLEAVGDISYFDLKQIIKILTTPRCMHVWQLTGCLPFNISRRDPDHPLSTLYEDFPACFKVGGVVHKESCLSTVPQPPVRTPTVLTTTTEETELADAYEIQGQITLDTGNLIIMKSQLEQRAQIELQALLMEGSTIEVTGVEAGASKHELLLNFVLSGESALRALKQLTKKPPEMVAGATVIMKDTPEDSGFLACFRCEESLSEMPEEEEQLETAEEEQQQEDQAEGETPDPQEEAPAPAPARRQIDWDTISDDPTTQYQSSEYSSDETDDEYKDLYFHERKQVPGLEPLPGFSGSSESGSAFACRAASRSDPADSSIGSVELLRSSQQDTSMIEGSDAEAPTFGRRERTRRQDDTDASEVTDPDSILEHRRSPPAPGLEPLTESTSEPHNAAGKTENRKIYIDGQWVEVEVDLERDSASTHNDVPPI